MATNFYPSTASADRQEYAAAVAGGYENRLAEIFRRASERAAAAAAAASRAGQLPPWVLREPDFNTPDPVGSATQYPVMQPDNPLNTEGNVMDDPTGLLGIDYGSPTPGQDGTLGVTFDDYEGASAAALKSGYNATYRKADGTLGVVTPREAYYDGLTVSADRAAGVSDSNVVAADGNRARAAAATRPAIEPGSAPKPESDWVQYPSRYPDPANPDAFVEQVFLGYEGQEVDGPPGARIEAPYAPIFMERSTLKNFASMPRDLTDAVVSMANAYYGRPVDASWIRNRWSEAVDEAWKAYQDTGILISPLEVYEDLVSSAAAADAAAEASGGGYPGGGGGYGGGGAMSSVVLTSETDARAILNQAMSAWLGRQATASEVDQFVAMLNRQEMANPVKQEIVGDMSIQSGGFNPQTFAEDFVKSMDGSAEYQAVTSYLDAFLSSLDGKVGVL